MQDYSIIGIIIALLTITLTLKLVKGVLKIFFIIVVVAIIILMAFGDGYVFGFL